MENDKYIVKGHLQMQGKDYYFSELTWLSFMIKINEMMREFEISFPFGEDDNCEMVKRSVEKTDKFS